MTADGVGAGGRTGGPGPSVKRLPERAGAGEHGPADDLPRALYDDLRRLAAARLAHERCDHMLDATSLVHEAYLRLVGHGHGDGWDGRGHFFAAAAETMRRILVERARRRGRTKNGGGRRRVALRCNEPSRAVADRSNDVLAVSEALLAFERRDPERAALVKLRYFGGLTLEQAAVATGISRATAARRWAYARAWLHDRIDAAGAGDGSRHRPDS
ncbi:MAG: ECF-type sigma factor [Planctomycetota bacterium]|jgi:RNA polymerase sigma factor (TIGR02999 family)